MCSYRLAVGIIVPQSNEGVLEKSSGCMEFAVNNIVRKLGATKSLYESNL